MRRSPKSPFVRRERWCAKLPEEAWTTVAVRDGKHGPLMVEAMRRRVAARTPTGGTGPEELLFLKRERQADGTYVHYFICQKQAPPRRRRTWRARPRRRIGSRWVSATQPTNSLLR